MTDFSLNTDVVVVGGGPSGIMAAIAAARSGMSTVLIESNSYLGGNLVLPGLALLSVNDWSGQPIIAGLLGEFVKRLQAIGGATQHVPCPKHVSVCALDPEMVRYIALEMTYEAGVQVLLYTHVTDVTMRGNRVESLIVKNKSGSGVVHGHNYVDATGDADIVARGGGDFEKGAPASGELQPMTLTFRLGDVQLEPLVEHLAHHPEDLNTFGDPPQPFPADHLQQYSTWVVTGLAALAAQAKAMGDFPPDLGYVNVVPLPKLGQVGVNAARVFNVDGTSAFDLTRAELDGRRKVMTLVQFFKKHVPGFADCVLLDMAPRIGVRETRRIVGHMQLTGHDIRNYRVFEDAIAQGIYPIDIHKNDSSQSTFILLDRPYTIPYRALLPVGIDNVIVSGRAIAVDRVAFGSIRVMSHCMAIGHAAGVAAALAFEADDTFSNLDHRLLQDALRRQNALTGI